MDALNESSVKKLSVKDMQPGDQLQPTVDSENMSTTGELLRKSGFACACAPYIVSI